MRRMMAQEVAAAKARGETISENTTSEDDSNISDDELPSAGRQLLAAAGVRLAPKMDEGALTDFEGGPSELNSLYGEDRGHEADMDDTSMSSRASSRLMGESIDSMNAM